MLIYSIIEGYKSIRMNPLQTFFSILGVVIGVASLVAILALGDGMEQYARQQVEQTTSLQGLAVSTNTTIRQNNVWVKNPNAPVLTMKHFQQVRALLDTSTKVYYQFSHPMIFNHINDTTQLAGYLHSYSAADSLKLSTVEFLEFGENKTVGLNENEVWISNTYKKALEDLSLETNKIHLFGKDYFVAAVLKSDINLIFMPLVAIPDSLFKLSPPQITVISASIEDVDKNKDKLEKWKIKEFNAAQSFITVNTNETRLNQLKRGMLIFKLVMGFITGISVLVGGIGVMNVMLMSVKERTPEIGIRKTTGAKSSHIVIQFLAEAVSISSIGCFLGFIFAFVLTEIATKVIFALSDVDLHLAWTFNTFFIVCIVAFLIGIVFGTFPAWKAARLHPIDAIQRV